MSFMAAADDELLNKRAANARLLRRLVLAPTPELVELFDGATSRELVDDMILRAPLVPTPPDVSGDDDFWASTQWWLEVMADPQAGFHERMTWFWHGHLTSGLDKSSARLMLDQLLLLRRSALGNFRDMLREITLDPAMLSWLDGTGSEAQAPNENYARELMELFAFGRDSGAYSEADVKAGAKALAGYWFDDENDDGVGTLQFEPENALRRPVTFLGAQVQDVDGVIDTVCDHPACARYISARLYDHLVGGELAPALHDHLASSFAESGLDIATLVSNVLTDDSFLGGPPLRPRSGLEWFLALERLVGQSIDMWPLETLGQTPLNPPNVAGWPGTERWKSAGVLLTKGQIALDESWDTATLDEADPVADVLRRAVLYVVSPATRRALDDLASSVEGRREQASLLHAAVAMCPEFSLI
jgi:uncharacterized protein (DUF1800 family)